MIGARAVRIAVAARAGGEGGVGGDLLAGAGAGEQPQDRAGIFERRHDLLDRGDDDVRSGSVCGQVAVALVGDDHRGAGLGDEQVGAGDADIGGEELLAQHGARLGHADPARVVEMGGPAAARDVTRTKSSAISSLLRWIDRRDDVARRLAPDAG